MFTSLWTFFSTNTTPAGASGVAAATALMPPGVVSSSGWALAYSMSSMRNSLRPRSVMDTPPRMSSRSTTSVWSRWSWARRYSRSPCSSGESRLSSPVEVMTRAFIRVSTRAFRLM